MTNKNPLIHSAMTIFIGAATVLLFGAAGEICGPLFETTIVAFDHRFPENDKTAAKEVMKQLQNAPSATAAPPLVVIATPLPDSRVVAFDPTTGETKWSVATSVNSPVSTGPKLVVFRSGGHLSARMRASGKLKWQLSLEEGWTYYGADQSRDTVVTVSGVGSAVDGRYANGRITAIDARTGQIKWSSDTYGGLLGAPVLSPPYVFVPWNKKQISVLHVSTGQEAVRLRVDGTPVDFVANNNGHITYGPQKLEKTNWPPLFHLSPEQPIPTDIQSEGFTLEIPALPGGAAFGQASFVPAEDRISHNNQIGLVGMVSGTDPLTFSNHTVYLRFWRTVFAFDDRDSTLKWVHLAPHNIVATQATDDGLFLLTPTGELILLNANAGVPIWHQQLDTAVRTATLDLSGLTVPKSTVAEKPDLTQSLQQVILSSDTKLLPARIFAVKLLAQNPAAEVTGTLLEMIPHVSGLPTLEQEIAAAITTRQNGEAYLLKALETHYDFLSDQPAPPLKVLALALSQMGIKEAVSPLLDHLQDPETPVDDLEAIANALASLGDQNIAPALTRFVTTYHADAALVNKETAMAIICEALLKFDRAKNEPFVAMIRDNPSTLPKLRAQLLTILDPLANEKAREKAQKEAALAEERRQEALARKRAEEFAKRPVALSRDQIRLTMAKSGPWLRPCIKNALAQRLSLRQVRMKFQIEGANGRSGGLQIIPDDIPGLKACLDEALTHIHFPLFKNVRQSASHTIRITGVKRRANR